MSHKILLLGKNGQLGWELQRALAPLGELIALDRHEGGDLAQPDTLRATLKHHRPDVIVNAAAYTAVDKAESEPELALQINARAPGLLAEYAAAQNALLLHYSSDYVFDGSGSAPRDEAAATGPLSVYGRSKLEGEQAIAASGCRHLILRTSWVYAARGGNFAKTMLRLAAEREQLKVIADQIGAPTGADLLADLSAHMLRTTLQRPELGGLYHAVAAGETSWHAYACHVIEFARARGVSLKVPPEQVLAIPTTDYPTPAQRPLNSRLSTTKLQQAFGLRLPPWQQGVERMLNEIL
ncbi:dTDP-4-dehydrorhamnose reductase [Kinneretia asaccharophila]|uniref:dTDP-4-dehydrorhamnose reductase n=1 Tax=Roseateles asaccharophilus TaxID=582607 RepID=A0A4R6MY05_9BURK|nr:dTDP-4-dehydrorhamnose reductase [Roseateles asaccharophilus]MDN3545602.1 dTDP-4-dehydrorhamnose reductase [Roseateles asaccharophilus]TDP07470.1 dTDP-4-dehydrorhamnose reductase [Roseateles asaccharophilus]